MLVCMVKDIQKKLKAIADPQRAISSQRFFKTGKGEYGEGDVFLGISVPQLRAVAKEFAEMPLPEVVELLRSPIHEHRLCALFILVAQFEKGDEKGRQRIVKIYVKNAKYVNNWDLVDSSAPYILGEYLAQQTDRSMLDKLAASKNMWEQRIAIIATYTLIKRDEFADTLRIAETLLHHEHDLIHKAVGWMLREVGNRNRAKEEAFLQKHYRTMPRTALRYAIEKFPETRRQQYLKGLL